MAIPSPTINDYISQIRFRVRRRESAFRQTVEVAFSGAGATGKTGAAIRQILTGLLTEFDENISEVLAYLAKSTSRLSISSNELYQVTVEELLSSAATFKSIVNVDRIITFVKKESLRGAIAQEFKALDEMLALRLREYAIGLHDLSPVGEVAATGRLPASDRYVSLADNEKGAVKIELALLEEGLRGDNEVTEEERVVALSEIAAFEATIIQPRVSSVLIERFVNSVLAWMSMAFAGAALKEAVQRLIQALARFI